ncbi:polysaccharide deacetylase family protein [Janthinobacterium sp. P210006]|uniref:polysaccharide deacetylase family protein n=1 Tax=Janthinobacterium sp. P210006 TaxID=3112939 RepID=UPI002E26FAED|nr:polysaccharide deacetylase family protein [Janthinobacterium sp. P210006]
MMTRFIFAGHAPAMLLCASAMWSPAPAQATVAAAVSATAAVTAPVTAAAKASAATPASAPVTPAASSAPAACKGTIYMTFDTGSQSQAQLIADVLNKRHVKATFFLANEKTTRGDYSLDPSWAPYWKARVAEGHAFGTHTFDHVYWKKDLANGLIQVKPQFGKDGGKLASFTDQQFCEELRRVDTRFQELTGRKLDPFWRAPGGYTSPRTLAAGSACGYQHAGWAPAGYSGDELPSDKYPNAMLLKKALANLRSGDIFIAHMGIWSRKDAWAPANLDALIAGLQDKGFCFATLREHPAYAQKKGQP